MPRLGPLSSPEPQAWPQNGLGQRRRALRPTPGCGRPPPLLASGPKVFTLVQAVIVELLSLLPGDVSLLLSGPQ